jgi:hypothetical protein
MGDVKSIENAVEALLPSALAEFRQWATEFEAAAWDQHIERDAMAGTLDLLAAEVLADFRSGSFCESAPQQI